MVASMAVLIFAKAAVPVVTMAIPMAVPMVAPMPVPLISNHFHIAILWSSKAKPYVPVKAMEKVATPRNTVLKTLTRPLIVW